MRAAVIGAFFAALLAGCSGPPVAQYLLDPPSSQQRLRPIVSSVEIRDVSLPRYAAADEIVVQSEDGALRALRKTAWADVPQRGVTLTLAENIGVILQARVAAEPWPFARPPAAEVSVSISQMLVGQDNILRLSGQYAIAPRDSGISDRSGRFDISEPVRGEGLQAVADAHGRALVRLSETIAQRLAY
ncbi:MAG: PqiC family protein [Mangrovicoccus sp.]|nr:PqiC family protein [Mangrovicoccus sp.]